MGLSFREASRVERVAEDTFAANIPVGWEQGRGAFGGLVLGTIVRAARAYEEDESRAVRTLSADIAGPVLVGPARIRVRQLRRGKSLTNLQLDLEQDGNVLTSALCTLSAPRRVELPATMPPAPPAATGDWQEAPLLPLRAPLGPTFAKHYEYRNAGPLPFVGGNEAKSVCFVRERPGEGVLDTASLTALLDAPWPSLFGIVRRPYPMATVSFSAQFLPTEQALPADVPLYSPGRMVTQYAGYCVEMRELWAGDQLVAMSQQTTAIVG